MIRIYQKDSELYIRSGDLNSFFETQESASFLNLRDFCTDQEKEIYHLNFSSNLWFKVKYIISALKPFENGRPRVQKWKRERAKALLTYLKTFITSQSQNEDYVCINL